MCSASLTLFSPAGVDCPSHGKLGSGTATLRNGSRLHLAILLGDVFASFMTGGADQGPQESLVVVIGQRPYTKKLTELARVERRISTMWSMLAKA